jgi:4-hydroxy-4-methyl-2-oxoglutarate aldolase
MLIDAAVRDVEELRDLGVPIWSRFIRARGASRTSQGVLNQPILLGGANICNGDLIVMDADGAVVVAAQRVDEVLEAALAREQREQALRERFKSGELSVDVYGLRADLEYVLK